MIERTREIWVYNKKEFTRMRSLRRGIINIGGDRCTKTSLHRGNPERTHTSQSTTRASTLAMNRVSQEPGIVEVRLQS